jgi:hypothetical protein
VGVGAQRGEDRLDAEDGDGNEQDGDEAEDDQESADGQARALRKGLRFGTEAARANAVSRWVRRDSSQDQGVRIMGGTATLLSREFPFLGPPGDWSIPITIASCAGLERSPSVRCTRFRAHSGDGHPYNVRVGSQARAWRAARAAASRRELTPSLLKMWATWPSTVREERQRAAAISGSV